MADWALWGGGVAIDDLATDLANSRGVVLTSGTGGGGKGSYAQLVASTALEYTALQVTVGNGSAAMQAVLDIAIGPAASEQIILADLAWSTALANRDPICPWLIPIRVASGTRLSARFAATSPVRTIECQVHGFAGVARMPVGLDRATTYGITSPKGVQIDVAGTANTKGAYSQITPSTTFPIKLLYLMGQSTAVSTTTPAGWLVDIAIGAAASEVDIVPNLLMRMIAAQNGPLPMCMGPFPVDIPAGTRLAVRGQASVISDANSNKWYASILGLG